MVNDGNIFLEGEPEASESHSYLSHNYSQRHESEEACYIEKAWTDQLDRGLDCDGLPESDGLTHSQDAPSPDISWALPHYLSTPRTQWMGLQPTFFKRVHIKATINNTLKQ